MEDINGDARYGCRTMPIVWGINAAKIFTATWLIVPVLQPSLLWWRIYYPLNGGGQLLQRLIYHCSFTYPFTKAYKGHNPCRVPYRKHYWSWSCWAAFYRCCSLNSTIKMNGSRIILASQSPRRKQLLEWAEIPFEVIVQSTEETLSAQYAGARCA